MESLSLSLPPTTCLSLSLVSTSWAFRGSGIGAQNSPDSGPGLGRWLGSGWSGWVSGAPGLCLGLSRVPGLGRRGRPGGLEAPCPLCPWLGFSGSGPASSSALLYPSTQVARVASRGPVFQEALSSLSSKSATVAHRHRPHALPREGLLCGCGQGPRSSVEGLSVSRTGLASGSAVGSGHRCSQALGPLGPGQQQWPCLWDQGALAVRPGSGGFRMPGPWARVPGTLCRGSCGSGAGHHVGHEDDLVGFLHTPSELKQG